MKQSFYIIALLLNFSSEIYAQKIPVTTKSKDALEFYEKGWEFEDKLKLDLAEQMYNNAINKDSTFALAYLRLAMLKDNYEIRRKQLKNAERFIENTSEGEQLWIRGRIDFYGQGYDGSNEYGYFKKLAELYPNDEMANYLFAFVNLHHGVLKPDLAIRHFEKAIKINPNFIRPYNDLIYTYLEKQDFKNAKRVSRSYIDILPNSVNPLDTYAEIFMRSGEYKKSIKAYKEVLKIDPKFPWALMGISANMNFLGKHSNGRTYIEKINEDKLSDYEYRHKWRAKVTSYLDESDIDMAIDVLEEQKQESISKRNKREPSFHIYFSYLRKTRLYFESNQPKQGLSEYENWVKYINGSDRSERIKMRIKNLKLYYLAYDAYLDNKFQDAKSYLTDYTKTNDGENDSSKVLLSKILIAEGKTEQAIEKLNETNLNNPYNQYWIMIAYSKTGDRKSVKKYKNKILQLNERNNIDLSLIRKKVLAFKV
ncbi:MAG: tetratricopeptide repeat protein [Xanthomarina gelatinilytica]|uniref:tetratricopeptide repeat protein n=1 Tax=Xanthomarina gelatinilytica TaxID=1137281 RepID=UPI003A8AE10F